MPPMHEDAPLIDSGERLRERSVVQPTSCQVARSVRVAWQDAD